MTQLSFSLNQIGVIRTPYTDNAPYQPVDKDKGDFRIIVDSQYVGGLSYKYKGKNGIRPSIKQVIDHLRTVDYEIRKIAEEYIRKAPKQIDTEYRRKIENEFGWKTID